MLYFRGRNQETKAQQDEEAAKVRLLLLPIADEIRESRKWLEPALYYRLSRQFGAVEHRLSRATSFDLSLIHISPRLQTGWRDWSWRNKTALLRRSHKVCG